MIEGLEDAGISEFECWEPILSECKHNMNKSDDEAFRPLLQQIKPSTGEISLWAYAFISQAARPKHEPDASVRTR